KPLALSSLGSLSQCPVSQVRAIHKNRGNTNAVNEAAKQEANLREAEALRVAYIMVAAANHDYDGHRVKAMKQLQEAVKILDIKVLNHGTAGQKDATLKEDHV